MVRYQISLVGNKEVDLIELVTKLRIIRCKSEAKRLLAQGAITLDGERLDSWTKGLEAGKEYLLKIADLSEYVLRT